MARNNKLIKISGNSIIFSEVTLPSVEEVLNLRQSEKGNRTFFQCHDVEDVWVTDGGYRVHVMVTCYVEAGSITGNEVAEAIALKDKEKAEYSRQLAVLMKVGFTEKQAIEIIKSMKGKGK